MRILGNYATNGIEVDGGDRLPRSPDEHMSIFFDARDLIVASDQALALK